MHCYLWHARRVTQIDACHSDKEAKCEAEGEARRKQCRLRERAQPPNAPATAPPRILVSSRSGPSSIHLPLSLLQPFISPSNLTLACRVRSAAKTATASITTILKNSHHEPKTRRVIKGTRQAPTVPPVLPFAPLPYPPAISGFRVRRPDPVSILSVSNSYKTTTHPPTLPPPHTEHTLRARHDPAKCTRRERVISSFRAPRCHPSGLVRLSRLPLD